MTSNPRKDHDSPVWNVGADLQMPIFRGGALKTQVEIRTAEQKRAIAEYAAEPRGQRVNLHLALGGSFATPPQPPVGSR